MDRKEESWIEIDESGQKGSKVDIQRESWTEIVQKEIKRYIKGESWI